MKILLLIIMLQASAQAKVLMGTADYGATHAVTIGDFKSFDLGSSDIFGIYRYGPGRAGFEGGGGYLGVATSNRGGFYLSKPKNCSLNLGFEAVSGELDYHDRAHYIWRPAISYGPYFEASVFRATIAPRLGLRYSNIAQNDTISGIVAIFQIGPAHASYYRDVLLKTDNIIEEYTVSYDSRYYIQRFVEKTQHSYFIGVQLPN